MKRIVILTGDELRHIFFKKFMSIQTSFNVIASFCESTTGNISKQVNNENNNSLRMEHLNGRQESEIDFFQSFCDKTIDESRSNFIQRGDINLTDNVNKIISLKPDIIISYGCSIIRSDLLQIFKGKFINIHLGLSPYYRGSGTNFWPFVEDELSLIGTTFMHIDEGIDTGGIIHQIRAEIRKGDSIHSVGNRLIQNSAKECIKLIENFESVKNIKKLKNKSINGKLYRNKDFTEESIQQAYHNLDQKIERYLDKKNILDKESPIINAFEV